MARREVGEINAGSMADIAFLLLIFFLVTTTMEVDAGIGRTLPLKRDQNSEPVEINERDVLDIMANKNDQLLVENSALQIEDLEEVVRSFYLANINSETNPNLPLYTTVTKALCLQKIAESKAALASNPKNDVASQELSKWTTKLAVCENIPNKAYREISNKAIIQLKNQANTSFGRYIDIQDILKKVVNDLRSEKAEQYGWGEYLELKENVEEDIETIERLRILVPERIVEAKIEK